MKTLNTPLILILILSAAVAYLLFEKMDGSNNMSDSGTDSARLTNLEREVGKLSLALNQYIDGEPQRLNAARPQPQNLSRKKAASSDSQNSEYDDSNDSMVIDSGEGSASPLVDFEEKQRLAQLELQYIDDTFNQEPVEEVWASAATAEVGDIFLKPTLQQGQVSNVDCRSSLCRIDLDVEKLSSFDEGNFENHMLMELTSAFKGGVNLRRTRNSDGSVTLVAYAVKEGHQIPSFHNNQENANGAN